MIHVCPKHKRETRVPTYKGKLECPLCLEEVQRRLEKAMK